MGHILAIVAPNVDPAAFVEPLAMFGKMLRALTMLDDIERHAAFGPQALLLDSEDEQPTAPGPAELADLRSKAWSELDATRKALAPLIESSLSAGDLESYRQQMLTYNQDVGRLHAQCLVAAGIVDGASGSVSWSRVMNELKLLDDTRNQILVWAIERLKLAHLLDEGDDDEVAASYDATVSVPVRLN